MRGCQARRGEVNQVDQWIQWTAVAATAATCRFPRPQASSPKPQAYSEPPRQGQLFQHYEFCSLELPTCDGIIR